MPFAVEGKCGSVIIKLIPAPRGTGLCVDEECKKILKMAGVKDIWSKTLGQTKTKLNLVNACFDALRRLMEMKIHGKYGNFVEGISSTDVANVKEEENEQESG